MRILVLWTAAAGLAAMAATAPGRMAAVDRTAPLRAVYSGPPETWPPPHLDAGVTYVELAPRALPPAPRPGSPDEARARLGERLFSDPALSDSGQIACESCHNRRLGWGDGLPRSIGHDRQEGPRNAPALFTAGAGLPLFWDGRADNLPEQALGPLTSPVEMANHDLAAIPARLMARPDYPRLFAEAYGPGPITLDQVTDALARFQTHLDRPTRLDRFLSGDPRALSDQEILGLHLFRTRARCANCHFGPLLADGRFHDLGLSWFNRSFEDLGRFAVSGDPADVGAFRTPSLRHVSRTGPYMHNGLFPHLVGVVRLYAAGGGSSAAPDPARPVLAEAARTTSPLLHRLDLDEAEIAALVAFLEAI
ncbi:cytochrome-c peroxidase [Rhodovulum strictum]|uniref:cytochrome-c peroxidase n=1 Tax=Rhodovulum strictum TaxID=58314 RepID=UPI001B86CEA4|nr:cytochrome c peroxidase [Rhodovulum strictum]